MVVGLLGPAPTASAAGTLTLNDADTPTGGTSIEYTGGWSIGGGQHKYQGDDHYADQRASIAIIRFTGTAIAVYGARAPWHGHALYSVDGGTTRQVDLYSPQRQDQQTMISVTGLTAAAHVLRVRPAGTRNAASTGTVISLDKITVTTPPSAPDLSGQFVTRSGSTLQLGGKPYRFTGANAYWMGLDDNITDSGQPTYPTKARIDNALTAAKDAGMTVIRAHTLGISVGCPRCVEPRLGVFQESALDSADYAISRARQLGLRVLIPLTDQWRYYHGGISVFTSWRGYANAGAATDNSVNAANNSQQRAAESHFYTDPGVIADFRQYVAYLLGHVNRYNGVAWKDDPTILAWETGNEIWTADPQWTQQLARYLKNDLGARQLVADGTAATGMHVADAAIDAPDVDILGGHFYPVDVAWAAADARTAAAAGKVYIIGEYQWTDPAATRELLSTVQATPAISGALLWTLMPYQEDGRPEPHGDGHAFYNPAVTTVNDTVLDLVRAHAAALDSG